MKKTLHCIIATGLLAGSVIQANHHSISNRIPTVTEAKEKGIFDAPIDKSDDNGYSATTKIVASVAGLCILTAAGYYGYKYFNKKK